MLLKTPCRVKGAFERIGMGAWCQDYGRYKDGGYEGGRK